MKFFILFCLITSIGSFTNCNKANPLSTELLKEDLIGYWEAHTNIQFMLGLHYCNSFELRNNNEFAIYYLDGGKPSNTRIDGYWSLVDGNIIEFDFNSRVMKINVIEFSETELKVKEDLANFDDFVNLDLNDNIDIILTKN